MLVTKDRVVQYISDIPPIESTLKECLNTLKGGELQKAALIASKDPALMFYLKELTKKPIYGFTKEINDPKQIFGILGLTSALAVVENFLFSKIMPKSFSIFHLSKNEFIEFQDEMFSQWSVILEKIGLKDDVRYVPLSSLLSATGIVCDSLFNEKKELIDQLKEHTGIKYSHILEKLTGFNIFDISVEIGKKWEINKSSIKILESLSHKDGENLNEEEKKIGKLLYLLFFHTVSQPKFLKAGLSDFIELDMDFVEDTIVKFNKYMEENDTTNS